jgi:hypothetical protein
MITMSTKVNTVILTINISLGNVTTTCSTTSCVANIVVMIVSMVVIAGVVCTNDVRADRNLVHVSLNNITIC